MGRQKSRNDKVMGTQDIGQVQELDEAFRQDNRAELSCVASTTNGTASRMQGVQSKFKMGRRRKRVSPAKHVLPRPEFGL